MMGSANTSTQRREAWLADPDRPPTERTSPQGSVRRPRRSPRAREKRSLCDDNHHGLKSNEPTWQAATFGGIQSLGAQLGEMRLCPACGSSVVRPISFNAALLFLLEELVALQEPDEKAAIYGLSASMLASWAHSHLPAHLGTTADPEQAVGLASGDGESPSQDWQDLGREMRTRREGAGLSRHQLSTLSGLADATIRNLEAGKHKPHARTIQRLRAVPVLWIERTKTACAARGD